MLKKHFLKIIVLTMLLTGMLTLAFNIQPAKAWTGTVYIRADGSIDPVSAPIQRNGNLYTLTGNITSSAHGIVVQRENIIINGAGYTVQGSGSGTGIYLFGRKNVTVRNTQIQNFNHGIWLSYSSNNTVIGNNITNNNDDGIYLDSSSNNSVIRNNITENNDDGIYLFSSFNNTAAGNNITNNDYGIWLGSYSSNNTVIGNNITNNNRYGIWLYSSSTSNNSVIGNNITANGRDGIALSSSSNNSIIGNNITNTNNGNGIWLSYSSNNTVIGNNITNNRYGISLRDSSNNVFCHNNFISNTYQVYTSNSVNIWDDGYPSGGNYWSDYNGTDLYSGPYQNETGSDGIGDTPYVIDENNVDHYPLMNPYTITPPKPPAITATVDIAPKSLNLKSKGRWITCYIELPEDYNVSDIDVSTVMLNGTIPVDPAAPIQIGDYDNDSIPDLMVTFNRTTLVDYIVSKGVSHGNVTLSLSGNLRDRWKTRFIGYCIMAASALDGDVNCDGVVDIYDVVEACLSYGSKEREPNWNPNANVASPYDRIDIFDMVTIAYHYGETYP